MCNYDTGILTFWNVPNYGTFAQAYALQRVVAKYCTGNDVRQIAYLNRKHYRFYYAKFPPASVFCRTFYRDFLKHVIPTSAYNKRRNLFLENYRKIPHTEEMNAERLSKVEFNNAILGSDIIWDYSFEVFDNDPKLFGVDILAKNKIAYAASFGTIRKRERYPEYVIEGIKGLNAISVRDKNSADIVKQITGIRPTIVLDPTWLWDFKSDSNIIEPIYENYIVVYGQDFTDGFIKEIIEYAKEHNLKLICLDCNNDNYKWCDIVIRQHELTPFEWIGFFRGAQAIATSTYHGLTFGLIFEKKLAFCKTNFIIAKAKSFLSELGLYELYNKENRSVKEMLNFTTNYNDMQDYIERKKNDSKAFLIKALNGKVL